MELFWLAYVAAGAVVGIAVGITGVGGGSLMTPLLLLFGFPPNVAIGTDLLYAAITKSSGVISHHKSGNIDWTIVKRMAIGSVPAAIVTSLMLKFFFNDANEYIHILTVALGIMLVLTALVVFFRQNIQRHATRVTTSSENFTSANTQIVTIIAGIFIGVLVTLTSVGAGAVGTAVLFTLYPYLISQRIVGTDIAHAVPLTLVAGLAHLWLGNVDFTLLGCLLLGSLPAIHLGTMISNRLPSRILQPILASILLGLGVKLVFF